MDEGTPLKISEICALLPSYSPRRVRRMLDALSRAYPGSVTYILGRRSVTLGTLRKYWPDLAKKFPTSDDVENLSHDMKTIIELVEKHDVLLCSAVSRIRKLESLVRPVSASAKRSKTLEGQVTLC